MIQWNKSGWGDDLIVPGVRIGGFILGKQPSEFLPAGEATIADWSGRCAVGVEVSESDGLVDATTGSPSFHTEEGFKVGTPFADVVAAWGEPAAKRELDGGGFFDFKASWPQRGIDLAVKDGAVLYIGVSLPE